MKRVTSLRSLVIGACCLAVAVAFSAPLDRVAFARAASNSTAVAPQAVVTQAAAPQTPGAGLSDSFAKLGIHLDVEHNLVAIPSSVLVRDDLLEYLLVNPHGAAHESMFVTQIAGTQLNLALLALGAAPGVNATWVKRDPQPTEEELRAGAPTHEVRAPTGDGFYLYAAWKQGGETYLHRMEDLVLDRSSGATMRRHAWVYLGSRMIPSRSDGEIVEAFAADLEGNLINVAFFEQGNTVCTAALPECIQQTIWLPNFWLLPPKESPVHLIFARERLTELPAALEALLPDLPQPTREER